MHPQEADELQRVSALLDKEIKLRKRAEIIKPGMIVEIKQNNSNSKYRYVEDIVIQEYHSFNSWIIGRIVTWSNRMKCWVFEPYITENMLDKIVAIIEFDKEKKNKRVLL